MKTLDTGEETIQKICDRLREETLHPAKQEAQETIQRAKEEAEKIIEKAKEEACLLLEKNKEAMEQEKEVFQASLKQSAKQTVSSLKQEIEETLFNEALLENIQTATKKPEAIANIITALVDAIKKEGLSTDFSAVVEKSSSIDAINALLASHITDSLKNKSVILGNVPGGAELKLHDKKMTVILSDETVFELVSKYVRKDFRKLLFS